MLTRTSAKTLIRKKKLLISTRKKFDENLVSNETESFPFGDHESEGTQKLFELSPFIYEAIKNKNLSSLMSLMLVSILY